VSKPAFESPAILAAVIAAAASIGIALAGVIQGSISAYYESKADGEHTQVALVSNILKLPEQERKDYAAKLIQSGLLKDDDGSICRAFIGQGCPKPKKSN